MDNSLWISSIKNEQKEYSALEENKEAEVCVIGGGLTGLTTAYYLSKAGKKVVLLEKFKIGAATSGNTTGKITSGHGLFYKYLIDSNGEEYARKYLEANEQAIKNIKKIIEEEKIDCDFENQDNYIFTQDKNELEKIKEEVEAVNKIGGAAEFVKDIDIHIKSTNCGKVKNEIVDSSNKNIEILKPVLGAIKFKNQAQFNSCKYMQKLANVIEKNNGEIFENSEVLEVEKDNEKYIIKTKKAKVRAKYVVLASHYPIINFPGFYFMKMYQVTSYLIAVETKEPLFNGMYINSENPTISIRTALDGDKRLILIGGMDHKTGAKIDVSKAYEKLEKVAKDLFPACKVVYRWNTQDCVSLDKIPYIGEFSSLMPNVYVGTGYKKWGITTSNIAANIISDIILGKQNKYEEIFDSKRLKPIKNYKELTNMVKEVGNSLIINKFKDVNKYTKDIKNEEGKIVEIDGNKVGIYKDKKGKVYAVKPICTHLGCELAWNNLDKTWDCPCHGSRFDYTGKNIYNPAIKDLERYE